MQEQKAATLATIFSEVLADLAFMFTDDEDFSEVDSSDPWLETKIGYRGAKNGDLIFRCTRSFTKLLASNLLGVDQDQASDEQANDAAKEFMNIVCGQLVTAMHGTDDVYNLTIPAIERMKTSPDLSLDDGDYASTISVENHSVQLVYSPTE